MEKFTLQELVCFDAVITEGGFQAAATKLNRTHSAVFAAVAKLERQTGLQLLDRGGYRIGLTEAGRSFHKSAERVLKEASSLTALTVQLAGGTETQLHVCIGDLCPLDVTVAFLNRCVAGLPRTDLQLHAEAISGPWERLLDGEVELIFHHLDESDHRFEWISLYAVDVVPVAAPGFLPFADVRSLVPEQMRDYTQCVIRDSARHSSPRDYFLVEGAQQLSVSDQFSKKAAIVQGIAWGHMPLFLVEHEIGLGTLVNLEGDHLKRSRRHIVAARLRQSRHGVLAERCWQNIRKLASRPGEFSASY
jgi:DNA-binding transcriptional LysR family regulator